MTPSAEDTYAFRHVLTRQGAYELMPPSDRARLHVIAADVLHGDSDGERSAAFAAEVVDHLHRAIALRGGYSRDTHALALREVDACIAAARRRTAHYRFHDAAALWRRAADNPAATRPQRIEALAEFSRIASTVGALADGERCGLAAAAEGEQSPSRDDQVNAARAFMSSGVCAAITGRLEDAHARFLRAAAIADALGDATLRARASANLANYHHACGDADRAEALFAETIDRARAAGDMGSEATARGNRALLFGMRGDNIGAERECQAALEISHDLGDRRAIALWTGNLGSVYFDTGRMAEAIAAFELAIAAHRELRDTRLEGSHLRGYADVLTAMGRRADAEQALRRSVALLVEVDDPRNVRASLTQLAAHLRASRADDPTAIAEATALDARAGALRAG
jgi:tetratricopeptide (TPR) repeat protein